jgi:type 1 fimbria pilin
MDNSWTASTAPGGPSNLTFSSQLSATVNLVVTGPVGSGVLSINPSGSYGIAGVYAVFFVGEFGLSLFRFVASGSTTVSVSSCTVNTPKINVNLPQANASALQNVGDTTGATTATIGLNCPAGLKVNVTLTDATTPTNTSATLTLTPDSSAKGVGLQILNNSGVPVAYGPDSAAAGNLNQWSAGVSAAGAFSIPLSVQYVRTSGTLVPGTVRGLATFTMSYQ